MLTIDAHCHLPEGFSPQDMEEVFALGFADRVWALSVPITHWVGTRDNDEVILELARAFPGRVIPFGYLNLAKGPDWVDRQRERGFAGLKAHTPPRPWDDDTFLPIYERAAQLGLPIVFHTGQAWIDTLDHYPYTASHRSRSTDWMHVERLDVIAKAFPSLTVVAAHMGWPHCEAAMGLAMTHPNFYMDTSGYVAVLLDFIARGINVYGIAAKLLLGSDLMLLAPAGEERRARIRTWQERVTFWRHYFTECYGRGPAPSAAELVLGGNAERLVPAAK
jgi:predicted TIM-barrel fold metal-dependent hydrolase